MIYLGSIVATLTFMAVQINSGEDPSAAVTASVCAPTWTGVVGLLVTPYLFFLQKSKPGVVVLRLFLVN